MDGSPVLRQQSQNTIRSDILRTNSQQNKLAVDCKSSKAVSLCPLQHNLENQNPESSGQVRPPHVRPGVSRLPVLAKSHHLQTSNEFTRSHSKWEEKALAGKARTKKPCTRPVPFNLSQSKSTRVASENQRPNAIHTTRTSKFNDNVGYSQVKTTNRNSKHSESLQENVKPIKTSENISQPLGQSKLSHKTSASVSKPVAHAPNFLDSGAAAAAAEKPSAAETCSKNMNLLSLKDASSVTKMDSFQHDHAALLSILQNEGVTSTMTSQSKPYNYLPQRVSVMKSRYKTELNAGSIKSVTFSPDHGALQSILKNEGVKAGAPSNRASSIYTPMRVPVKKKVAEKGTGLMGSSMKTAAALQSIKASEQNEWVKPNGPDGATPRNSLCPSGKSTSVYSAQRVPVKKTPAEPSPGPAVAARMQTPVQKWTPQRVTRHQPMSAVKWHASQPSPYAITPGFRSCKANLCPKQEEVVQKLFHEEDEENIEPVTLPQIELPPYLTTCKNEMQSTNANEKEEGGFLKEEELVMGPFIQNPERESVIFFSTGKKLFRDPRFKQPEASDHKQHNPEDTIPVQQQSRQIGATKDLQIQTDIVNPSVAMLRKRLPLLEEVRLDEEVATYTSVSVPTTSGFHPPRPRCQNPVATILHFEESTRFVPISFGMSPSS